MRDFSSDAFADVIMYQTKFKEYDSFQVIHSEPNSDQNEKETLSIRIQEMARGETYTYFQKHFYDRLNEIQTQMIANINNLMTDRHIVNKTFKEKYEGFRRDLFSKYQEGFKSLPKD